MVGGTVPGMTPGPVTDRDFGTFSHFCVYKNGTILLISQMYLSYHLI